MCQSMKTEKFYRNHLWKYFDKHFKEYEDTVKYFVDPAPNQWKFTIPELDQDNSSCMRGQWKGSKDCFVEKGD